MYKRFTPTDKKRKEIAMTKLKFNEQNDSKLHDLISSEQRKNLHIKEPKPMSSFSNYVDEINHVERLAQQANNLNGMFG